ncbi:MAG: hypothetical protein Unbinned4139contig1000_25 [Prokaryotic dsDNA virus sp.]|nr:MAG: hypothetical protein Unbinned4139contig1000_25 [Prokaryotic dsDNA virus sp.]|tara:strand:+ start:9637 stop:9912 length:276 start_codon:yes stop_codon:yes gene_type:complete
MIPASFAPMILKLIMPKVMDHFMKTFKLDKVLKYVEQPNELDVKVKDQEEKITYLASELGMLQDKLNKLEILSKKTKKSDEFQYKVKSKSE